jgi:hypothetical protein
MSTTYGATGFGQTAASKRCISSFFKGYWMRLIASVWPRTDDFRSTPIN